MMARSADRRLLNLAIRLASHEVPALRRGFRRHDGHWASLAVPVVTEAAADRAIGDRDVESLTVDAPPLVQVRVAGRSALRVELHPVLQGDISVTEVASVIDAALRRVSSWQASRHAVNTPATAMQRDVWLAERSHDAGPAYTVCLGFRFSGDLDVDRLSRSLNSSVQHNDALRATLVEVDGQLFQSVSPLSQSVLEWDRGNNKDFFARCGARSFDVSKGPLFRAILNQTTDGHLLALCMHHSIIDGAGLEVLLLELESQYVAGCAPIPGVLSSRASAVDYSLWYEHQRLSGQLAAQAYSLARLYDPPQLVQRRAAHSRYLPSLRGAVLSGELDSTLRDGLQRLADHCNASLATSLLATFGLTLALESDSDFLVVDVPFVNRPNGFEGTVGYLANVLPIVIDVRVRHRYADVVQSCCQQVVAAFSLSNVSRTELVQALSARSPGASLGRTSAMFTMQETPFRPLHFPGLSCDYVEADSDTAQRDLVLKACRRDDGLILGLRYRQEVFSHRDMDRFFRVFAALSREMAADPSGSFFDFSGVDPHE